MITEVPTPAEFQAAGLNQLYLAWQLAIRTVEDFEFAEENVDLGEDRAAAASRYWAKSQPVLANAFGLIQQAMEMVLKGRIASVSPFLLIPRDPREWPRGVDTDAVPFSEFRTLDAADLIKVHNTFITPALDQEFQSFWDEVRRDRNKIMHSVSPRSFEPATLVRALLTAATALFTDVRWPQRLLDMEENGKWAAYGIDDGTQNTVMQQMDIAVRHLKPSECKRLLGHDKKRRSYVCPNCHGQANRDWQTLWPKLAQLETKAPGEPRLHCLVCDATMETERAPCPRPGCEGDVMFSEQCMTCLVMADDPSNFEFTLVDDELGWEHEYRFEYRRAGAYNYTTRRLPSEAVAREYGRLSMLVPHLATWADVIIHKEFTEGVVPRARFGTSRLIGGWTRTGDILIWQAAVDLEPAGPSR